MGEGERGTKTTVLLLEAPYKDRALAGAALIDLLPLGHSSCSMLCRRSYLQCELPLPSSQATLQHPGSSTNCPHSVVAYAQRDVPMHSRPKLHAPAMQVPQQDPVSTTLVVLLYALSTVVLYSQLPLRIVPSPTFQHPFHKMSPLRSIPYSQRELPRRVVRRSSIRSTTSNSNLNFELELRT